MHKHSMNDPYSRTKANFILDAISKGVIPSEFQFHFLDRVDNIKVYTNEQDAINNFYNDTFIAIILFYPSTSQRNNAKGWIRAVGDTTYQKTGGTKEYNLDTPLAPFTGSITNSYIRVLKQDESKPRILQNEIEFPAKPIEKSKVREPTNIPHKVTVPLNCPKFIQIPDLSLVRVVIRSYYEKGGKLNSTANPLQRPKEIKIIQYTHVEKNNDTKLKKAKTTIVEVPNKIVFVPDSHQASIPNSKSKTNSPKTTPVQRKLKAESSSNCSTPVVNSPQFNKVFQIESPQSCCSTPPERSPQTNSPRSSPMYPSENPFQLNSSQNSSPIFNSQPLYSQNFPLRNKTPQCKKESSNMPDFGSLRSKLMESNLPNSQMEMPVKNSFRAKQPETKLPRIDSLPSYNHQAEESDLDKKSYLFYKNLISRELKSNKPESNGNKRISYKDKLNNLKRLIAELDYDDDDDDEEENEYEYECSYQQKPFYSSNNYSNNYFQSHVPNQFNSYKLY